MTPGGQLIHENKYFFFSLQKRHPKSHLKSQKRKQDSADLKQESPEEHEARVHRDRGHQEVRVQKLVPEPHPEI